MTWISQFVLLAALAAAPSPSAAPSVPTPQPSAAAPQAGPSPAPPPTGAPASAAASGAPPATAPPPTATPAPAPTFNYHFVPRPEASPDPTAPQILEVDLNSRVLRDTIAIRVMTNDVVTRVENHTQGHSDVIPQVGPGQFLATGKLPKVPFIARGWTINLEFVAFGPDGRKTSVKVPVKLG
jgi:hypothetical protein